MEPDVERGIRTVEDVLRLLDGLFTEDADRWTEGGARWWDGFYAERDRGAPFFVDKPDENLVACLDRGLVPDGSGPGGPGRRALDLGCGPGRNARFLAARGFAVDAVDLSAEAIGWASERARSAGVVVRFHRGDAFAANGPVPHGRYHLIYDSGCFHHLPPHRRISYLALLERHLAPGGHLGLTCFAAGPGGMGSELPDARFYREGRLHGGLAYSARALRHVFAGFSEIELRRMRDEPPGSARFGEPFLWTALFRRDRQHQTAAS